MEFLGWVRAGHRLLLQNPRDNDIQKAPKHPKLLAGIPKSDTEGWRANFFPSKHEFDAENPFLKIGYPCSGEVERGGSLKLTGQPF